MKKLIEQFPGQLAEALAIAKSSKFNFSKKSFQQVLVSGLGGSGIGASIVEEYVFDKLSIPFVVNKDYSIPKSVNANTLFIACSYSGNTEETLMAVNAARKCKATIVCITSGGELASFAKKNKYDLVFVYGLSPILLSLPGIFISKIKGIQIILWVQDLWPESLIATKSINNKIVIVLVGKLVKWIYKSMDLILVQSKSFIDEVKKMI